MRVLFLIILSLMLNGYSWAYLTAGKIAVTSTSSSSGVPSTSQDSDITDTKGSSVSVGVPVAVTGNMNITGVYQVNGTPISATSNWNQNGSAINYTAGNVGIGSTNPGQTLDVTGTVRASAGFSGLVLGVHNTSTQSINASTWTQRTFGTIDKDSGGYWASNTYTPLVAGWYLVTYTDGVSVTTSTGSQYELAIYKNGSLFNQVINNTASVSSTVIYSGTVSAIVQCNGSTDYIQFYVWQDGSTTGTAEGTGYSYASIVRVN